MLAYLLRAKNKKGFTILELVVVLAMIGILVAITVPLMSDTGNKSQAQSYAKNFYFAAQDTFIQYKSENDFSSPTAITEGFYPVNGAYATAGGVGVDETFLFVVGTSSKTGLTDVSVGLGTNYKCLKTGAVSDSALCDSLNSHLDESMEVGFFYAVIDSQCRVVSSFWTRANVTELSDNYADTAIYYTDMDYVGEFLVGSYPLDIAVAGQKVME